MKKVAIFASGGGTNAENICQYFNLSNRVSISLICTNNKNAFVLSRLKESGIPSFVFSKKDMNETSLVENMLARHQIDFIILAGFLLKVPKKIIQLFDGKIINIHPSLLPKYGGKGMYGKHIHQAVIESGEEKSGITIHFVNENYDDGDIIFQRECFVSEEETVDSLSLKIHNLEQKCFPLVIEETLVK